ncbi:hypothetical protein V8C86DRAFT_2775444 [Haematococcus lacustris]
MGKSQFQAAKAARYASADGDGDGDAARPGLTSDGMTDVTYHTPAWHAARIAELTRPRMNYEEWKQKAKEAEGKLAEVAAQEEERMREYRAMLDADRAKRLAQGSGKPDAQVKASKDKKAKKKKKGSSKDGKKRSKKSGKDSSGKKRSSRDKKSSSSKKSSSKKKRRRKDDGSDGSGSESGSSSSSSSSSSSDSDSSSGEDSPGPAKKSKKAAEPVRLSDFMKA